MTFLPEVSAPSELPCLTGGGEGPTKTFIPKTDEISRVEGCLEIKTIQLPVTCTYVNPLRHRANYEVFKLRRCEHACKSEPAEVRQA